MLHNKKSLTKNGLIDMAARWDAATIPYYIDDSFSTIIFVLYVPFLLIYVLNFNHFFFIYR